MIGNCNFYLDRIDEVVANRTNFRITQINALLITSQHFTPLAGAMPGMTSGGASGVVYQGYGGIQPSLKLVDSYPMYTTGRYPVTGYQGENDMSKPIVDPQSGYQATGFTEGYKQPAPCLFQSDRGNLTLPFHIT